ncbi:MAG: pyridoxamine 5'-phosphate oxidase family protein [Burkholderiales bacterium]
MTSTLDVAFTPAVREVQARRGSRRAYENFERRGGFESEITPELAEFIAARDSFFFATANASLQPYVQHRGGPAGFLHVLDARTLGFADHRGNRQYITLGNLAENPRAFMFLMDYRERTRIKIWGTARVVEDDAALIARLAPPGYDARPEQAILFTVTAWDANCPQHIPRLYAESEVDAMKAAYESRIAELEARLRDER